MAEATENPGPPQRKLTLTEQELLDRLGWFTRIRWLMGAFALLMLLVSWSILGVKFRSTDGTSSLALAANAILVIFLYNAVFTFLLHIFYQRGHITGRGIRGLALGQIVCDSLAVCALVHYTGGVENHFLILILLPLVIACELLPRGAAYLTALGAAVLVHALAWGEQQEIIPHVQVVLPSAAGVASQPEALYAQPLHVLHVTTALAAMMFATVFIASAISVRLRERERELETAYDRLHRIDEAKGFFMRKAGHELRAPLAAILSILDSITHQMALVPPEHARLMERAKRRTRVLMELVKELRRYSWLRSPEGLITPRPVALEELVENAEELFRQQAEGAGLLLTCHAEPVFVDGDEEMLREVVTNLVSNALQYTPAGGRIDVRLKADGDRVVLSVADTGIGISDAARKRLFEEFYRAPEAKRQFQDGTGLGLSITKSIIAMHHGRIDASSRPGGGTIFSVSLPARREKNSGPAA
ncbi:MAG TPA: HAMP domain-containing sensor histidine kinase [Phycisphaerae bacterium]|nr:HAMP domain-containing sensor histidine kinase [Phycisphaerae bacterium]